MRLTPGAADSPLSDNSNRPAILEFLTGLARVILLLVLVVAPWIYGGAQTHIQYLLYCGILISLAVWIPCALWKSLTTGLKTNRLPLVSIPILGGLILGAYQLQAPPTQVAVKSTENLLDSTTVDEGQRRQLTKSALIESLKTGQTISPTSTRFAQQKLLIVVATFFLGTQLFATQSSQLWLWGTMAVNGAALAFFGLAQQLSWNGRLFWTVPLRRGGIPFSSFVNRNNAAGYLCICLAAGLGFLIWAQLQNPLASTWKTTRPPRRRGLFKRLKAFFEQGFQSLGHLTAAELCSGACVILITTGIVVAISRGGWLAFGTGAIVTGLFASRTRGLSVIMFVGAAGLLCVVLIAWTGLGERVSQRWNSLVSADVIAGDGRWIHWGDSLHAVRDFPITGTGYGTYRYAYLPYQSNANTSTKRFYNADNQFIEWLVEGGFAGLSLVLLALLLTLIATLILFYTQPDDPVGLVGLFLLASQCVSAFFDFGPVVPANMLALATIIGAIAGRSALLVSQRQIRQGRWLVALPAVWPSVLVVFAGIGLLVTGFNGMREIEAAAKAHAITDRLPKFESPDSLDAATASELIAKLSDAVANYPGDPETHLALADLWIFKFRLDELKKQSEDEPDIAPSRIWPMTNPAIIYGQTNIWDKAGQIERIEALMELPTIQANLAPAYDQLLRAQSACALTPDVDRNLAMLAFVGNPQERSGETHLRRALVVAPASASAFYQIGIMAYFAGLSDFSFNCLRKSLELSPQFLPEIHATLSEKMSLEEELELVLPESAELLIELALDFKAKELALDFKAKNERPRSIVLAKRALELLETPAVGKEEAERRYNLARAKFLLGETDEALEEYRKALMLRPDQIDWRIEMIRQGGDKKGFIWALREAEISLKLLPHQKRLHGLVRDLRTRLASQSNPLNSNAKSRKP